MSIESLDFAEPFFSVKYIREENEYSVEKKSILVNLDKQGIQIQNQNLGFLQSAVVTGTPISTLQCCLLVEDFERNSHVEMLFEAVKKKWLLAYEATKEDRHKDAALWRTEKICIGNVSLNMCYAGTVPLNVGLHKIHWGGEIFKEVHTQIAGFGKMQQCLEQNIDTLYLEELLAPGATHRPMCDEEGNYPWHQYETITPGIFMPIEMKLFS